MNNLRSLFIILIASGIVTACTLKVSRRELAAVRRIGLVTMEINNRCLSKRDTIKYMNINFIAQTFFNSFITNYNALDPDCRFIICSGLQDKDGPWRQKQKLSFSRDTIYFPNTLSFSELSTADLSALCLRYNFDAVAVFSLTASTWAQEVKGLLQIFSPDGGLLWRQKISAQSTYIIQDAQSPYIAEYDKLFDKLEARRQHKDEVVKMYREIAENLALKVKTARYSVLRLDRKKKTK